MVSQGCWLQRTVLLITVINSSETCRSSSSSSSVGAAAVCCSSSCFCQFPELTPELGVYVLCRYSRQYNRVCVREEILSSVSKSRIYMGSSVKSLCISFLSHTSFFSSPFYKCGFQVSGQNRSQQPNKQLWIPQAAQIRNRQVEMGSNWSETPLVSSAAPQPLNQPQAASKAPGTL